MDDVQSTLYSIICLASVPDINALSSANANRYLIGYGVHPIPNGAAARRQLVKLHIGCKPS